jgi:hypothetical protein
MKEKTSIAGMKVPLNLIAYREVITLDCDKYYLNNVNILLGRKVIKKIRFKDREKPYISGMGKDIAIQYLKEQLTEVKKGKKPKTTSKIVVEKAAENLFEELGL